eukprot:jgi/Botrbrau1/10740/Bobra.180_2s0008.3
MKPCMGRHVSAFTRKLARSCYCRPSDPDAAAMQLYQTRFTTLRGVHLDKTRWRSSRGCSLRPVLNTRNGFKQPTILRALVPSAKVHGDQNASSRSAGATVGRQGKWLPRGCELDLNLP